jgi:glycosyltransferase involved in cell wall biosynthesis
VEFIGEIGDPQKGEFLGNAAALLFPIAWREPFGLVMIEAMACGTPVIAFENGSVPEVLEDGVTGFIVQNENQAVAAAARIGMLDRDRIRAEFDRRFTAQHMAQNYLKLYARLAKARRTGTGV